MNVDPVVMVKYNKIQYLLSLQYGKFETQLGKIFEAYPGDIFAVRYYNTDIEEKNFRIDEVDILECPEFVVMWWLENMRRLGLYHIAMDYLKEED